MSALLYAKKFFELGIAVIPLHHRNKKPDTSLIGGTWEQYCAQSNTEYELISWLSSGWLNYGVVCGWNNLVVIDFDSKEYFDVWSMCFADIADRAFKVITSRGCHVYVQTVTPCGNDKRRGIDVQAQRKFVVGPGSIHPNGTEYVGYGDMVFPMVADIESILPLDLFPRIATDTAGELVTPIQFTPTHTEYDPFQTAMFGDYLDLIDTVKSRVRIESMFPDARKTSNDGRWLSCLCPFHDDTNPSFWIDTRRQICGCAVCLFKPMDCINLYARQHNMTESDSVRAMAKEIGVWG